MIARNRLKGYTCAKQVATAQGRAIIQDVTIGGSVADFLIFTDTEELSLAAAGLFVELAHKSLGENGRFIVALSGGSTPGRMFEFLAGEPFRSAIPWDRTLVFWGDERAVPPDHGQSNYKLANEALLSRVPIPETNIFRIRGELGPDKAAEDMRRDMVNVFGDKDTPRFDLVLQGMGADGHTASLFPGTDALDADDWVVPVLDPPADPKVDRVTLTFPVLNNARTALFLATGKNKQSLIAEIMNDPSAAERYPVARVEAQETIWYVDNAAFGA